MAAAKKTTTKSKPETIEGEIVQPVQAIAVREQDTSPNAMIAHAMAINASPEYLMQLLDVKKAWEADKARKAFNSAFAAFKSENVIVEKRKKVGYDTKDGGFVGYTHAELSDVADAVGPAMAKHGLSYSWDVDQSRAPLIIVTCTVEHADGHSKAVRMEAMPDNSGKKNGIQQVASTVTYLQRYTLLAAAGVAARGMDDDGRGAGRGADESQDADNAEESDAPPDPLLVDLNSAADEGTEKLMKVWAALSLEARNKVGAAFIGIKKRAAQNDPR